MSLKEQSPVRIWSQLFKARLSLSLSLVNVNFDSTLITNVLPKDFCPSVLTQIFVCN